MTATTAPTTDPANGTTTGPARALRDTPRRGTARIVAAFAAWDFVRTVRMVESTFFIVVLPTALYFMFGALAEYSDAQAGNGNVAAYNMVSMAVYGAALATSSIAGSAAVERQKGWGRQLGLTGLTGPAYITGKVLVALAIAVLPILVIFAAGALTGARLDGADTWLATGVLTLVAALPFAFYGLAAALLFRSEAAVSAASGLLVVLAFFGNLFLPLSGTLLTIAKFLPMYGAASLARWPQLEGSVIAIDGPPSSDPVWLIVANVVGWTVVFALVCVLAARRTTGRG